ncbi:MAG TPA: Fic family protein [Candidatus Paceibacterota bacterium]|nr:Fic family protein [Candidatus Paceibacterota bacterium]
MTKTRPKGPFNLPKLPPKVSYADIVEHIAKAHTALARLDEMLKHMGNLSHLESTFFTREAVLSSKIEGTQVTLEDVLKEEAEGKKEVNENTERQRDIVEVLNYRRALRLGLKMIGEGESLAENNVKELHKILLQSERGRTRAPGQFRREQVYIAPKGTPMDEARYIPPSPNDISELYSNFDRYLNTENAERDPLVQIAVAHYQFEAIHPFKDGNGRVGRLLIPLFLYKRKIIAHPFIYISKYFEEHRRDYYDLLADVSYERAWTAWIRFFLHGLCEQANEATELGRAIIKLRDEYRSHLAELHSTYAFNLLDAIFERPYFTPVLIGKLAHIKNPQTVLTLIGKFLEAKIITDLTPKKKRNKIYEFHHLTKLLQGRDKKGSD